MKLRYAVYVLLLLLTSFLLFASLDVGKLEAVVKREREGLLRMEKNIFRTGEALRRLKSRVKSEGLPLLSRKEALEKILLKIDELKREYEVKIIKDIREEKGIWKVGLRLEFKPVSGRDLSLRIKRLLGMKSPVAVVESLTVDAKGAPKATVNLTLYQPFVEEKR